MGIKIRRYASRVTTTVKNGVMGNREPVQTGLNNYAPSTNVDVTQNNLSMQLGRTNCAGPLQKETCLGLEDSNNNFELSRPISNESVPDNKKSHVADVNHLNDVALHSKSNSFPNTVSYLADVEDNTNEEEKASSKTTDLVDHTIDCTKAGILDNYINELHNQMGMIISHCDSSNIPIQLYEAEMSDHASEIDLQPNMEAKNLQSEASNMPSASAATAVLQVNHPSKRFTDTSAGNLSILQTSTFCEDPCSESIVEQPMVLMENDVGQTSRCSYSDEKLNSTRISPTSLLNGYSDHDLISNMFATGFDLWTNGNPLDLVQLLFDGRNVEPFYEISLRDTSNTRQSRFHFARQGDGSEKTEPFNLDLWASPIDRRVQRQNTLLSKGCFISQAEVSPSDSFENKESYAGETFAPSVLSSFGGTPPGFSTIRPSFPPPGFSQHSRSQGTRISESRQDCTQSLNSLNMSNKLESIGNNTGNNVEFIDPAIMAVGRDKQPEMSSFTPFIGNSSLLGLVTQAIPFPHLPSLIGYCEDRQPIQERTYSHVNNIASSLQTGYSNHEDGSSLRLSFYSSFKDVMDYKILSGKYFDPQHHHIMQDYVYGNDTANLRFQATQWNDWNRVHSCLIML